ncbi:hypothetical protein [Winogradskyella forsetii]|uniref:hypothetical protein n=1 Tax=Winogradskyella forsetii TaxID=2686077 RepID=UPI0015B860F4|nr:hypothetical protein [Winogradskyella forsetii]
MNESEKIKLLNLTENLMTESKIEIRDTWKGWEDFNYDDFYSNGNAHKNPKLFDIIIKENGHSETSANKSYSIPNFKSLAYDNFKISIPKRLTNLEHPIIHEIIHFLQHSTAESEKNYIAYNGTNYEVYVNQRTELEAHFVQLLYIEKFELNKLNLEKDIENEFISKVKKSLRNPEYRLELILYSKSKSII